MTSDLFLSAAKAYRDLFWPEFVKHDGCVFLSVDEGVYKQWLQQTNGDKHRVEAVMNHRHIVDILPQTVEQPSRELAVTFGELLQETWSAKLRRDFPQYHFAVRFSAGSSSGLEDYEITFFQTP